MENTPQRCNTHKSSSKKPSFTPSDYEFRITGRLSPQTATWFEDMTLTLNEETDPPQTLIRGHIVDQAALYGLISRARDLGLTLVSVKRLEEVEEAKIRVLEEDAYDNIETSQAAEDSGD